MKSYAGRPNLQLALVTSGAIDDVAASKYAYDTGRARNAFDYRQSLLGLGYDPKTRQVARAVDNPTGEWQQATENAAMDSANRGFGTGGSMFREGVRDARFDIKRRAQQARSAMNLGNQDLQGRAKLAQQMGDKKASIFAATDPSMQRRTPIYGTNR